jgi:hypothetical protein
MVIGIVWPSSKTIRTEEIESVNSRPNKKAVSIAEVLGFLLISIVQNRTLSVLSLLISGNQLSVLLSKFCLEHTGVVKNFFEILLNHLIPMTLKSL